MSARSLVRSDQWWHYKVPPLLGVAAVAIGARPGSPTGDDLADLALLLVSVAGIAALGHLVNDWADIEADARGGKANALAGLAPGRRVAAVVVASVVGLVPWAFLDAPASALVALAVEVVLLLAYSLPPVRLKARGWPGALADAAYAYTVPFVLVVLALGPAPGGAGGWALIALLGTWGLLLGLRGILWHQVDDLDADRASGVETVAARRGLSATEALVSSRLLPLELVAGFGLLVAAGQPWLWWVTAAFVGWRLFQVLLLWEPPLDLRLLAVPVDRVRIVGFEFVNQFIERWFPLAALVVLAAGSWWWWLAVAVYLVAFHNGLRDFLGHDLWVIPDAMERLAFSRGIRADIAAVAERRVARVAQGPDPLADPTARRWVFVVCGPLEHLLTLRTAVHHLRPVTDAEIWVLTDSRRNEQVIDIVGVDHICDVETPAHLDDHQASIWLKTSVHRHLPPGEWCYLDSDVIAVQPGVEGVFDDRGGPVAFASDVTIRDNSVDRFSPWAMTCECSGMDDEHSCTHLREQLQVRFGLDVPGDWLHWNGGVFLFGTDSAEVLDLWHQRAVASFDWPEWKTRDQGALIATVWSLGLQDLPRVSPPFNFIADLGNGDLCLDKETGWAHHPSGPWYDVRFLHLYTSPLDDPEWDLGADVEAVVLRRSRVRVYRYRRSEVRSAVERKANDAAVIARGAANGARWRVQVFFETVVMKARRMPRKLRIGRINRAVRARLGMDVSHLPIPGALEPEPQRSRGS